MKIKIIVTSVLSIAFIQLKAQQGDIGNEEITITKERTISLPKANRVFEKIPPVEKIESESKVEYKFYERKPTGIQTIDFVPKIVAPKEEGGKSTNKEGYPNYVKIGAGNFGRLYGETFLNSPQNQNMVFGLSALHNSARRGPIQGENSGNSITKIGLDGKYHNAGFELNGNAAYERRNYYFYGYDTARVEYDKEEIRQRLNIFNFSVGIENTKVNPVVDYKLTTGLRTLKDYYNAEEIDWGSKFTTYFPIVADRVTAVLEGEAYLTQRTDNYEDTPTRRRNLFRISPYFNIDYLSFNAKIGYKAVNEFDQIKAINQTKGFPTVTLTYKTPRLLYFFAGYDGDIIRNTLGKYYDENPFIKSQVDLENTIKEQEFFIGSRGEVTKGLAYDVKASYGKYNNLYYYNIYDAFDGPLGVRKFEVYYDNNKTDFVNISAEVNYQAKDFWQTNLSADYFYYETIALAKAYHRPSFEARLGNIFKVSDKIVSNLDFYFIGNTVGNDPFIFEDVNIPAIIDINAEITYLFSQQFSAFVKLNNLVGNNYQRFLYYPQMGLNFVAGINVSL